MDALKHLSDNVELNALIGEYGKLTRSIIRSFESINTIFSGMHLILKLAGTALGNRKAQVIRVFVLFVLLIAPPPPSLSILFNMPVSISKKEEYCH